MLKSPRDRRDSHNVWLIGKLKSTRAVSACLQAMLYSMFGAHIISPGSECMVCEMLFQESALEMVDLEPPIAYFRPALRHLIWLGEIYEARGSHSWSMSFKNAPRVPGNEQSRLLALAADWLSRAVSMPRKCKAFRMHHILDLLLENMLTLGCSNH